jgi:hypothetical protein
LVWSGCGGIVKKKRMRGKRRGVWKDEKSAVYWA